MPNYDVIGGDAVDEKEAVEQAIDAAWNNPAGAELRAALFPEVKPVPDLFVQRLADYARRQMSDRCPTL